VNQATPLQSDMDSLPDAEPYAIILPSMAPGRQTGNPQRTGVIPGRAGSAAGKRGVADE
jgi:hypothetical protein